MDEIKLEEKYYLIKLANNDRYYGDTLTHCGSSIEINGRELPIIVREEGNITYDYLTNREVKCNIANHFLNFYSHVDGLSYVSIARITSEFFRQYKEDISTLTPEDLVLYNEKLTEIENRSRDLYEKNNNDSFGLGQLMCRKLFKKSR